MKGRKLIAEAIRAEAKKTGVSVEVREDDCLSVSTKPYGKSPWGVCLFRFTWCGSQELACTGFEEGSDLCHLRIRLSVPGSLELLIRLMEYCKRDPMEHTCTECPGRQENPAITLVKEG